MITTKSLAKRAAEGDADAQFRMGYRLAFGRARKARPNWGRVAQYWRKAAEAGHVRAQFYLGTCYDDGHGVPQDLSKALLCYKKAARRGHDVAQYNIALAYFDGDGVRRSPKKAVEWYSRSASPMPKRSTGSVLYSNRTSSIIFLISVVSIRFLAICFAPYSMQLRLAMNPCCIDAPDRRGHPTCALASFRSQHHPLRSGCTSGT